MMGNFLQSKCLERHLHDKIITVVVGSSVRILLFVRNISFGVDCATKWGFRMHSNKSLVTTLTRLNTFKKHFITIDNS